MRAARPTNARAPLARRARPQVFEHFMQGTTLQECYAAVAEVANHWLDVLLTRVCAVACATQGAGRGRAGVLWNAGRARAG